MPACASPPRFSWKNLIWDGPGLESVIVQATMRPSWGAVMRPRVSPTLACEPVARETAWQLRGQLGTAAGSVCPISMIFACAAAGAASTAAAARATVGFKVTAVLNTAERRMDRSTAPRWLAATDRNLGEDALEDAQRGPRAAVGADEARVPGVLRRRRVPVVQVDAADARADRREGAQEEACDLRGVRGALREADQRLVA